MHKSITHGNDDNEKRNISKKKNQQQQVHKTMDALKKRSKTKT